MTEEHSTARNVLRSPSLRLANTVLILLLLSISACSSAQEGYAEPAAAATADTSASAPPVGGWSQRSRAHIEEILIHSTAKAMEDNEASKRLLQQLKEIYFKKIRPVEKQFHYADLGRHVISDADIHSKPLVLLVGPWSTGKSTIINYILGIEGTLQALFTGAEPTTSDFTILTNGAEYKTIEGIVMATDTSKPFAATERFGQNFLERLLGIEMPSPILQRVTFIDTPGILENRKQQERGYPYNEVMHWMVNRADLIFVVFDPTKLDIGSELESLFRQLKGKESQLRIILNKADSITEQQLMRVYGALFWSLAPLINVTEPPRIYVGSFWSNQFLSQANEELFLSEEMSLLHDMSEVIKNRIAIKIASIRQHAIRVRNHALLIDSYVAAYRRNKGILWGIFGGGGEELARKIVADPAHYNIYKAILAHPNISEYDLPDPSEYDEFFKIHALTELKRVSDYCGYISGCALDKLDGVISQELPHMLKRYLQENGEEEQRCRGRKCSQPEKSAAKSHAHEDADDDSGKGKKKYRKERTDQPSSKAADASTSESGGGHQVNSGKIVADAREVKKESPGASKQKAHPKEESSPPPKASTKYRKAPEAPAPAADAKEPWSLGGFFGSILKHISIDEFEHPKQNKYRKVRTDLPADFWEKQKASGVAAEKAKSGGFFSSILSHISIDAFEHPKVNKYRKVRTDLPPDFWEKRAATAEADASKTGFFGSLLKHISIDEFEHPKPHRYRKSEKEQQQPASSKKAPEKHAAKPTETKAPPSKPTKHAEPTKTPSKAENEKVSKPTEKAPSKAAEKAPPKAAEKAPPKAAEKAPPKAAEKAPPKAATKTSTPPPKPTKHEQPARPAAAEHHKKPTPPSGQPKAESGTKLYRKARADLTPEQLAELKAKQAEDAKGGFFGDFFGSIMKHISIDEFEHPKPNKYRKVRDDLPADFLKKQKEKAAKAKEGGGGGFFGSIMKHISIDEFEHPKPHKYRKVRDDLPADFWEKQKEKAQEDAKAGGFFSSLLSHISIDEFEHPKPNKYRKVRTDLPADFWEKQKEADADKAKNAGGGFFGSILKHISIDEFEHPKPNKYRKVRDDLPPGFWEERAARLQEEQEHPSFFAQLFGATAADPGAPGKGQSLEVRCRYRKSCIEEHAGDEPPPPPKPEKKHSAAPPAAKHPEPAKHKPTKPAASAAPVPKVAADEHKKWAKERPDGYKYRKERTDLPADFWEKRAAEEERRESSGFFATLFGIVSSSGSSNKPSNATPCNRWRPSCREMNGLPPLKRKAEEAAPAKKPCRPKGSKPGTGATAPGVKTAKPPAAATKAAPAQANDAGKHDDDSSEKPSSDGGKYRKSAAADESTRQRP